MPNTPWFTFSTPDTLFTPVNENKSLYRIISFDSLLQMLNEQVNVLVPTNTWEDVYENFILKEEFFQNGKRVPIWLMSRKFYGQCWTAKRASDAMWRIYSPDKKGIQIRTRIGKLYDLAKGNGSHPVCFLGKVDYLPQSKIEKDLKSIGPSITEDELSQLMLHSQFIKRNNFSHEDEYRIIYMSDLSFDELEPVKKFPVDPLDFIEAVCFDPRVDSYYVDRCTKVLVDAFGFPKSRIRKSNLYSFKPLRFELVDDNK